MKNDRCCRAWWRCRVSNLLQIDAGRQYFDFGRNLERQHLLPCCRDLAAKSNFAATCVALADSLLSCSHRSPLQVVRTTMKHNFLNHTQQARLPRATKGCPCLLPPPIKTSPHAVRLPFPARTYLRNSSAITASTSFCSGSTWYAPPCLPV